MVVVAVAVGRGHMAVKQEFGRLYPTLRALRLVNIGSHAWLCWNLVSLFKILFCILNYTPSRSTLAVQLLMRQRITFLKKNIWCGRPVIRACSETADCALFRTIHLLCSMQRIVCPIQASPNWKEFRLLLPLTGRNKRRNLVSGQYTVLIIFLARILPRTLESTRHMGRKRQPPTHPVQTVFYLLLVPRIFPSQNIHFYGVL